MVEFSTVLGVQMMWEAELGAPWSLGESAGRAVAGVRLVLPGVGR